MSSFFRGRGRLSVYFFLRAAEGTHEQNTDTAAAVPVFGIGTHRQIVPAAAEENQLRHWIGKGGSDPAKGKRKESHAPSMPTGGRTDSQEDQRGAQH